MSSFLCALFLDRMLLQYYYKIIRVSVGLFVYNNNIARFNRNCYSQFYDIDISKIQ